MKNVKKLSSYLLLPMMALTVFASCEKENVDPLIPVEVDAPALEETESGSPIEQLYVEMGTDGQIVGESSQNPWDIPQTEATYVRVYSHAFYKDSQFRGANTIYSWNIDAETGRTSINSGITNMSSTLSKNVSSFMVAAGCELSFYTDVSGTSPSWTIKSSEYPRYYSSLGSEHNDRYTKYKVTCTDQYTIRNSLCGFAYEHSNYGGTRLPIFRNYKTSGLVSFWNDRISSYQAIPAYQTSCKGVEFYENSSYGGWVRYYGAGQNISYVGNSYNDRFTSLSARGSDLPEGWSSSEANDFINKWEANAFTGQGFVVNGTDIDFGIRDQGLEKALTPSQNCDLMYLGMRLGRHAFQYGGLAGGVYFCGGSFLIAELISGMTATTGQPSVTPQGPSPADLRGSSKWGEFMGKSTRELAKPKNVARGIGCVIGAVLLEASVDLIDQKIDQKYQKCRTEAGLTPSVGTPISLR